MIDLCVDVRQRVLEHRPHRRVELRNVELRQIPEHVAGEVRREEGHPREIEPLSSKEENGGLDDPLRRCLQHAAKRAQTADGRLAEDLFHSGWTTEHACELTACCPRHRPAVETHDVDELPA